MHSFMKIIDVKAYHFLKVVIHIFLLEAILLTETKIQRSFVPNPTKKNMKRSSSGPAVAADQNGFPYAQSSQNKIRDGCRC